MSTPYREEANLAVLRHVGTGERILDVGCGRGRLGEEMRRRGNRVHGVELDADAAAVAAGRLDFVHHGDVTGELPDALRAHPYDTIVCADVLEHTADPAKLLRALRPLLRPGGRVIVSLPNVASWPMRLRLLAGDFTYADAGVLDRTHLRFFTRKTAAALVRDAGFDIEEEDATPYLARAGLPLVDRIRPRGANDGELADSPLYRFYARWLEPWEARVARLWPELLAFQVVLVGRDRRRARPDSADRLVVAMITRNEERAVEQVIQEIRQAAPWAEVLLVDSSTDATAARARALGATVIEQLPPRGYGPAMQRALQEAAARGDVVVTLDCDGTYPATAIPELVRLVRDEGWDVVNATRMAHRPQAMPLPNWMANALFAQTSRLLHGLAATDVHSGMRAYRAQLLRELRFFAEAPALPVELLIKPARLGYRVTEIPIEYRDRIGETTLRRLESTLWTFRRIFALLGTGHRVRR